MAEFVASMSRGMEDGLATSRRVVIAVMVVVMMGLLLTKLLVVGRVKERPPSWGSMASGSSIVSFFMIYLFDMIDIIV